MPSPRLLESPSFSFAMHRLLLQIAAIKFDQFVPLNGAVLGTKF